MLFRSHAKIFYDYHEELADIVENGFNSLSVDAPESANQTYRIWVSIRHSNYIRTQHSAKSYRHNLAKINYFI